MQMHELASAQLCIKSSVQACTLLVLMNLSCQYSTDLAMWCICQGIWDELSKHHPGHAASSKAQCQGQQECKGVHKHEGGHSQQGLGQGCEQGPPGCFLCSQSPRHQNGGHCQALRNIVQPYGQADQNTLQSSVSGLQKARIVTVHKSFDRYGSMGTKIGTQERDSSAREH